jgi:hypothetical protein
MSQGLVWKRRLAKYSRWLHIYVSMASFAVVFFFAATGITLNHPEWFAARDPTTQAKGHLDPAWTNTGTRDVAKAEIVAFLRRTHHFSGALNDVRVDDQQCSVSFKGPGYAADVFIDRRSGDYDVTESRLGFVAVVNDLHKGRDTGTVWKAVIDVSAALLTFISLTGLILLYFVHKHRLAGFVLLILGALIATMLYVAWVP